MWRWQPWILTLAVALAATPAAARSQRDLAWSLPQTWTSAIRLLRLDLGFPVTERDRDAGFLLFEYVDGEHRHPASLELVERILPDGRTGVRVVVSVPAMPTYVELHLLDRLERKLRTEVGEPPPPPPPRAPASSEPSEDEDEDGEEAREEDADDED